MSNVIERQLFKLDDSLTKSFPGQTDDERPRDNN